LNEGEAGTRLEVECRERVYRASSAGESLADASAQVFWSPSSCMQASLRIQVELPDAMGMGAIQAFDPETSAMQPVESERNALTLVRTYMGAEGFTALIRDFSNGYHAFGIEDFRDSYSPAQWTQLRPKLWAAGFRGAKVFLKIELSDEMKRYLGASTARADVPSVILE
jgi:type VI secretion system protein ImpL